MQLSVIHQTEHGRVGRISGERDDCLADTAGPSFLFESSFCLSRPTTEAELVADDGAVVAVDDSRRVTPAVGTTEDVREIDRHLEERLAEQAAAKGAALVGRLRELQERRPLNGDVRGRGLMVGVELVSDRQTKAYGTAAAAFVRQYCLEHNVLIGVGGNFGNVLRLQPPLVIDEAQLDVVLATIAAALEVYAAT